MSVQAELVCVGLGFVLGLVVGVGLGGLRVHHSRCNLCIEHHAVSECERFCHGQ